MFYAHYRKENQTFQPLSCHLFQSAKIASYYGKALGTEKICYLAALLHDFGKFSDTFQEYLKKAAADPDSVTKGSVDHSTPGAQLLAEKIDHTHPYAELLCELVANAILSHHSSSGLKDYLSGEGDAKSPYIERVVNKKFPDFDTMRERFFQEVISEQDFEALMKKATAELTAFLAKGRFSMNQMFFLEKFIYSCVLEGDRTNTRLFEDDEPFTPSDYTRVLNQFSADLEDRFRQFSKGPQTKINKLRQQMADECLEAAGKEPGVYKLSIPTGGGKTLSSLRFAINHALKHQQQRIIYVIPFNSIIEQNAQVARDVLKDSEHILEHHSNVLQEDTTQDDEDKEKDEAILRDNWDSPLIFTTMVRFLEIAFAGGTRNPRRFHQLANAVLIFDEVQSIPTKCIYLFNELCNFLVNTCHTTILLCTATQPALEEVPIELSQSEELISNLSEVDSAFKRTDCVDLTKAGGWSAEEISSKIQTLLKTKRSLLVILNTKKAVRTVYQALQELPEGTRLFHLSTSMCPMHRKDVLKLLKKELRDGIHPIVCVTTPLIEAGVDVSFECVIRSTTGLDSIAQASGRCNRNGEFDQVQPVYLINPMKSLENIEKLKEIDEGKKITEMMLKDHQHSTTDLLDKITLRQFFLAFYNQFQGIMKYPLKQDGLTLFEMMGENPNRLSFYEKMTGKAFPLLLTNSATTIAQNFHVIDTAGTDVLVPYVRKESDQEQDYQTPFENVKKGVKQLDGVQLITRLNGDRKNIADDEFIKLIRQAQFYSVTLYDYEIRKLEEERMIYPLLNGEILALQPNTYDEKFGVNLEADSYQGPSIF